MLPSGINSTRSGGSPNPRETCSVTRAAIAARFAASPSRDSATTTIFSVPLRLILNPKSYDAPFANSIYLAPPALPLRAGINCVRP